MSDQESKIFGKNLGPKSDFMDAHPTDRDVLKLKEKQVLQTPDEADIILDLGGWKKLIQDEENLEFLRESLEDVSAAPLSHKNLEEWAQVQKALITHYRGQYSVAYRLKPSVQPKIEGYYVPNSTGCARTEGVSKIPLSEKRKYLPQYAKANRSQQEAETQAAAAELKLPETRLGPEPVTKSARADRIAKRNSAKEENADKPMTSNEDGNKASFSQLSMPAKHLRLGRSPIHCWGLFSETKIVAGDMVIEFVGEVVSQKVSEKREKSYLENGIGSSYLFTLDNGFVVDGTKKGNMSRFINHSCTPNVVSKIRTVDGIPRIFFFASREIETGKLSPAS